MNEIIHCFFPSNLPSDQSHTFRRGGVSGSRQSSDDWRRSRGDDDDNEQSED